MSVHIIYMKDGHKMMRPVTSRAEYMALRDSEQNRRADKHHMVQMNYSCLPNPDGTLRGSKQMTDTVGMDIDVPIDTDFVLSKKDALGLLMFEHSATKADCGHIVFRRHPELTQEENLKWASDLLGVPYDTGAKDITRVFYTPADKLVFIDDEIFNRPGPTPNPSREGRGMVTTATRPTPDLLPSAEASSSRPEHKNALSMSARTREGRGMVTTATDTTETITATNEATPPTEVTNLTPLPSREGSGVGLYLGIPYSTIIAKWWEMYNDGQEPCAGNRNTLTFELAVNLRHICGFDRNLLNQVIPDYWAKEGNSSDSLPMREGWGGSPGAPSGSPGGSEKMSCIDSALSEKRTQMPKRLKDLLTELKKENIHDDKVFTALEEVENENDLFYYNRLPKGALAQGIRDSIQATGEKMAMPVLAVTCPMVGALATDVKVLIHGKETQLNMHSFVVGDAASCKGDLDPVVEAWMTEETAKNKMYHAQEEEYRRKKKAAKNKKEQPDEPHLPVRFLTMNNTVPNLAERLANTDGKHAFSFTPEADTVAQKWRSSMSDFSTMLRQAYDGSRYDREAKSAEATTVHIEHLLWNVSMCGTPDALYRVISNYTDGLLSRFVIAHTPDNTFAPLDDKPSLMTERLRERIGQVAHLLPLMRGTLNLPKLEARCREWVEKVRRETLLDDDHVRARARLRDHGTAVRMTVCLILCMVAEKLIKQHGLAGAEQQLKTRPTLTQETAAKCQTPAMLDAYEVIAESLIDNDMLYFRDKLEGASANSGIVAGNRHRKGNNDRIYDRLTDVFTFDQAMGAKGGGCSRNSVHQMLKNWRKQGVITWRDDGRYEKVRA